MHRGPGLLFFLFAAAATVAHASVAFSMEEPYGEFGRAFPAQHEPLCPVSNSDS